ncbi:DNA-directed RNA polymerase subunit A'' [uncultured archaeon]|nr:DNA-directed RNA polymerase subunit A'' [uncultured archaeon]
MAKKIDISTKVQQGEPVGVIAAQSIGEPGTQMILKTFHFAGIAATITTSGLPRIVELLDAKKIPTTPFSSIYLMDEAKKDFVKADQIAKKINEVRVNDISRRILENFSNGKIRIVLDKQALEAVDLTPSQVAARISKAYELDAAATPEGNVEISTHTKVLKDIRSISVKLMHALVSGVAGAGKAVVTQSKTTGEFYIESAGSNIELMLPIDGIDKAKIYTNDVFEMYKVLGIEAARNVLAKELKETFDGQGININERHVLLVADAMTSRGHIESIGRHGLVGSKESVFARAAFEETVKHLINAAAFGETDFMRGVTENILVGKQIPLGTGVVKLAVKKQDVEKKSKK